MHHWLSIQYLRGIAASLVVLDHMLSQAERFSGESNPVGMPVGAAGVDLFFVISGFIMWVTTFGRPLDPLSFWRKRIIRIGPLYWLFTLLLAAVTLVTPGAVGNPILELDHTIASMLFIPAVRPGTELTGPLLPVGWTLTFEAFFYLVFGLGLILAPQRRLATILAVLGGLALLGAKWAPSGPLGQVYTSPLLLEFAGGIVLGWGITSGWSPSAMTGWMFVAIGSISILFLTSLMIELPHGRVLWWGVPALMVIAGAVAVEQSDHLHSMPILHLLGDASYSIYLSHLFVIGALRWGWGVVGLINQANSTLAFVFVGFTLSLSVGVMVNILIERPLLSLFKSLASRARLKYLNHEPR